MMQNHLLLASSKRVLALILEEIAIDNQVQVHRDRDHHDVQSTVMMMVKVNMNLMVIMMVRVGLVKANINHQESTVEKLLEADDDYHDCFIDDYDDNYHDDEDGDNDDDDELG